MDNEDALDKLVATVMQCEQQKQEDSQAASTARGTFLVRVLLRSSHENCPICMDNCPTPIEDCAALIQIFIQNSALTRQLSTA